jgi:hypothetical protein
VDALGFQALKVGEGFVGHRPSLNLLNELLPVFTLARPNNNPPYGGYP